MKEELSLWKTAAVVQAEEIYADTPLAAWLRRSAA